MSLFGTIALAGAYRVVIFFFLATSPLRGWLRQNIQKGLSLPAAFAFGSPGEPASPAHPGGCFASAKGSLSEHTK